MEIEARMQLFWEENHFFETDAPDADSPESHQEKSLITFPYPYMNGRLHLGHAFSLSKCEFAAGFDRLMGGCGG